MIKRHWLTLVMISVGSSIGVILATSCGSSTTPAGTTYTVDITKAAGTYSGTWKNSTFSSTGTVSAVVAKTRDGAGTVTISFNGGSALGETNPTDSFAITNTTTTGTLTAKTSTPFGAVTGSLKNDGTFSISGSDPGNGSTVKSYTVSGTYDATQKLTTTASITLKAGSTASSTGTMTFTKARE
jgi:hypothetical protein